MLKAPPSPEGGLAAILAAVRDLTGSLAKNGLDVEHALENNQEIDPSDANNANLYASRIGIPIYVLSWDSALHADYLSRARPAGWRHLVRMGSISGIADIEQTNPNTAASFAGITWGDLADDFTKASHIAERAADGPQDFEVRVLEASSLGIAAIWLKGDESSFIPYVGFSFIDRISTEAFHTRLVQRARSLTNDAP